MSHYLDKDCKNIDVILESKYIKFRSVHDFFYLTFLTLTHQKPISAEAFSSFRSNHKTMSVAILPTWLLVCRRSQNLALDEKKLCEVRLEQFVRIPTETFNSVTQRQELCDSKLPYALQYTNQQTNKIFQVLNGGVFR